MSTTRKIIATKNAPAAVGPYSQGVQVGNMVYTAGQVPQVPATGKLVARDVAAQTRQSMENVAAVLEAAGASLSNVVKTTIFVTDISQFGTVNEVYGSFFRGDPSARSTVQVAALPLGAQVEIEAVAITG